MNRLRSAWSWITSSPLRAAAAGAVAVTALVAGVAFGNIVNGIREPDGAAAAPSVSAEATPSASASEPEASPSATAAASATESATSPTPAPVTSPSVTAAPTPSAVPASASVFATPEPSEPVASVLWPVGLRAVTITEQLRVRSEPTLGDGAVVYRPTLGSGATFRLVEGPILASGYTWYRVADISPQLNGNVTEGWVAATGTDGTPWFAPAAADGTALFVPSLDGCADFEFPAAPITVDTLADLQEGLLGTWVGCVTTPWVAPYPVVLTFRDDGTYSSVALVPGEPAMYYGSDDDSPEKQYAVNDLQDNLEGVGEIDVYFGPDNTNRGELRNIRLMDNQLEFEFFHRGQYGPLTYELHLADVDD